MSMVMGFAGEGIRQRKRIPSETRGGASRHSVFPVPSFAVRGYSRKILMILRSVSALRRVLYTRLRPQSEDTGNTCLFGLREMFLQGFLFTAFVLLSQSVRKRVEGLTLASCFLSAASGPVKADAFQVPSAALTAPTGGRCSVNKQE